LADGSLNGRMALIPKEEIGAEVHKLDQFFFKKNSLMLSRKRGK